MKNIEDHILACLSSAPSNERIIRTAAELAEAFDSPFTALFVETPDFSTASSENKQRLQRNCRLAEELGATVETVYGEDVAYQIAEFARLSSVTKIVLGRSAVTRKHFWAKPSLTEQLISYTPEIDIHIIPDHRAKRTYHHKKVFNKLENIKENVLKSLFILFGATLLSLLFYRVGFTDANIIMVYILGVLLTSIATSHQIYSLISSVFSVLIFNYLFTKPIFSLSAYGTGYPVTFIVMFLTAFITGTFAIRYKEQARQSAKAAFRSRILFDTDQLLSKAGNKEEILQSTANQIVKLLGRNILLFDGSNGELTEPVLYSSDEQPIPTFCMENEKTAANWTFLNNRSCGAGTAVYNEAHCFYLALRVNERVYGVIGIQIGNEPLDATENSILLSILGEAALALENEKNAREKEAAALFAQNEKLRADLLRSISHDLRTPLTSISGNASNLLSNGHSFDEKTKQQLYADIFDESLWLINLVENLLSSTRIEEGRMNLRCSTELLSDIVEEAVSHSSRSASSSQFIVEHEEELLLVHVDPRLILQVITNLLDNALKYSPKDAPIHISTKRLGNTAELSVFDLGPGVPNEEKVRIFDKFYCCSNIKDLRRSLGLGLFLCKAIVEAHGGSIYVEDNKPNGSIFRFTLPLEEVNIHE